MKRTTSTSDKSRQAYLGKVNVDELNLVAQLGPRVLPDDAMSNEVVSPAIISEIFEAVQCCICLRIYEEPMRLKSCLHTYCKQCIETNLKMVLPARCTLCRKKVMTKRHMRRETTLQAISKEVQSYGLVAKIVPDVKQFNREVEENLERKLLDKRANAEKQKEVKAAVEDEPEEEKKGEPEIKAELQEVQMIVPKRKYKKRTKSSKRVGTSREPKKQRLQAQEIYKEQSKLVSQFMAPEYSLHPLNSARLHPRAQSTFINQFVLNHLLLLQQQSKMQAKEEDELFPMQPNPLYFEVAPLDYFRIPAPIYHYPLFENLPVRTSQISFGLHQGEAMRLARPLPWQRDPRFLFE